MSGLERYRALLRVPHAKALVGWSLLGRVPLGMTPFALLLLGFGLLGRSPALFVKGGASRAGALFVGLIGGALVFVAIEVSPFAAYLP